MVDYDLQFTCVCESDLRGSLLLNLAEQRGKKWRLGMMPRLAKSVTSRELPSPAVLCVRKVRRTYQNRNGQRSHVM